VPSRPCCEGHPEGRNQRSDGLAAGYVDRVLKDEVGRSSSAGADQALGSLYLDIGKGSFDFRRFSVIGKRTHEGVGPQIPIGPVLRSVQKAADLRRCSKKPITFFAARGDRRENWSNAASISSLATPFPPALSSSSA